MVLHAVEENVVLYGPVLYHKNPNKKKATP